MERPRFTLAALRRIQQDTGHNLLATTDASLFGDLEFWEKVLRAIDQAKADEWLEAHTVHEILRFFLADTRGGDATADGTKSPGA